MKWILLVLMFASFNAFSAPNKHIKCEVTLPDYYFLKLDFYFNTPSDVVISYEEDITNTGGIITEARVIQMSDTRNVDLSGVPGLKLDTIEIPKRIFNPREQNTVYSVATFSVNGGFYDTVCQAVIDPQP